MSYRITTDSTCDMPREFYTEHSIPCVGLGFQINGKEYREGSEDCMPIHDFYEALRGGAQSTTMQVNTYDFIDFVEPYLQAGEDVLHLCFSSGLSGTYESVERGAAELREKSLCRAVLGAGMFEQVLFLDNNRAFHAERIRYAETDRTEFDPHSLERDGPWPGQDRPAAAGADAGVH